MTTGGRVATGGGRVVTVGGRVVTTGGIGVVGEGGPTPPPLQEDITIFN